MMAGASVLTPSPPSVKMKAFLHHVGQARVPVVIIDHFWGDTAPILAIAASLRPFPAAPNNYPGLRRVITTRDAQAHAYINAVLERAAPFVCRAFDLEGFRIGEASFSMITTPPGELEPPQRAPHFDSLESNYLACLHYLVPTAGTAFYRHRATGIEEVTAATCEHYVATARGQVAKTAARYIVDSNDHYEKIGYIEGLRDRLAIYPGRLLHSALVTPDLPLSDDPLVGRITTNIFIRNAA